MYQITVERPGGRDQYGNPKPPATHTVDHCWDAPAGSTETTDNESSVEWDLDLFVPGDADVLAEDVILLPDDPERYQVHGRPQAWRAPTGWAPGKVVRLKGVNG